MRERRPDFVTLAPDCGPHSALALLRQGPDVDPRTRRRRRAKLRKKVREAEPGWLFARDVFEERRNDGLLTLVENPHVSRGWDKYYRKYQSRHVVRARRKRQGKRDRGDDQLWVRLDQCRFGQRLRRPSRRGVKVRKRIRFLLSDEKLGRLMKQRPSGLNCACPSRPDGRHDHAMQPRGKGQDQTKRTK